MMDVLNGADIFLTHSLVIKIVVNWLDEKICVINELGHQFLDFSTPFYMISAIQEEKVSVMDHDSS